MKPEDFFTVLPDYTYYIQYKGIWDMQDLYETMADFFRNQKFKFYETFHRHKRPTPFGADVRYRWQAMRNVEDYYRFVVEIYMEAFDSSDIEVRLPDGNKKIYTKGRIFIRLLGRVEVDYEKKWEDNVFYAQLRNFYNKYVLQKKFEAIWWDELHYKVCNKLRNIIQQRLKMESEEYEHRYFAGVH